MAMLDVLHELSGKKNWRLAVAHLNHRLRGRQGSADERLVRRVAEKLGLPVITGRIEVKRIAREKKISVEMAAREARHEFLARAAARLDMTTIALAHHADDQVELFFLRLLRGSGSEGLAGMKWSGRSPADPRIELVRPLLDVPKAALREFAAARKIKFREDATNSSPDIQRNRLRHELLPLLRRKYQPSLERVILRAAEIASEESAFIGAVAEDWLRRKNHASFLRLHTAVQRRCVQLQLQRRKIAVTFELVEALRARPGCGIKVSPDLAVKLGVDGRLSFQESKPPVSPICQCLSLNLKSRPAATVFDGVRFGWRLKFNFTGQIPRNLPGQEWFDAEKIGDRIVLRHWRAGDRFQPSGLSSPVKLQDLFVNAKIPRVKRANLAVAETADGEIFWVEGLRIAERFKLSPVTKRCLQWRWKRI